MSNQMKDKALKLVCWLDLPAVYLIFESSRCILQVKEEEKCVQCLYRLHPGAKFTSGQI